MLTVYIIFTINHGPYKLWTMDPINHGPYGPYKPSTVISKTSISNNGCWRLGIRQGTHTAGTPASLLSSRASSPGVPVLACGAPGADPRGPTARPGPEAGADIPGDCCRTWGEEEEGWARGLGAESGA